MQEDEAATTASYNDSTSSAWKTKPNFKLQFENETVQLFSELNVKDNRNEEEATDNNEVICLKYFGIRDKSTNMLIEMSDITYEDRMVFLFCSMRKFSNGEHFYLMHLISLEWIQANKQTTEITLDTLVMSDLPIMVVELNEFIKTFKGLDLRENIQLKQDEKKQILAFLKQYIKKSDDWEVSCMTDVIAKQKKEIENRKEEDTTPLKTTGNEDDKVEDNGKGGKGKGGNKGTGGKGKGNKGPDKKRPKSSRTKKTVQQNPAIFPATEKRIVIPVIKTKPIEALAVPESTAKSTKKRKASIAAQTNKVAKKKPAKNLFYDNENDDDYEYYDDNDFEPVETPTAVSRNTAHPTKTIKVPVGKSNNMVSNNNNSTTTTTIVPAKNVELNGMDILIESQKKMENNMYFMSQQILNLQLQKSVQPLQPTTLIETVPITSANQPPPTSTTITNNNNNNNSSNSAAATVDMNSLVNLLHNNNHNNSSAYPHPQYHQQQHQQQVFPQPSFFNAPYYIPPFPYPVVKPDNTAFLSYLAHLSSK